VDPPHEEEAKWLLVAVSVYLVVVVMSGG
jgi:hypothetical protein